MQGPTQYGGCTARWLDGKVAGGVARWPGGWVAGWLARRPEPPPPTHPHPLPPQDQNRPVVLGTGSSGSLVAIVTELNLI